MKKLIFVTTLLLLLCHSPQELCAGSKATLVTESVIESKRLHALFDSYFEELLRLNPIFAAYSLENNSISEARATSEVERYIAIPGQALSYKIGELKIQEELRRKADKALGSRFDIRAFHDEILRDGAPPLDALEMKYLSMTARLAALATASCRNT